MDLMERDCCEDRDEAPSGAAQCNITLIMMAFVMISLPTNSSQFCKMTNQNSCKQCGRCRHILSLLPINTVMPCNKHHSLVTLNCRGLAFAHLRPVRGGLAGSAFSPGLLTSLVHRRRHQLGVTSFHVLCIHFLDQSQVWAGSSQEWRKTCRDLGSELRIKASSFLPNASDKASHMLCLESQWEGTAEPPSRRRRRENTATSAIHLTNAHCFSQLS